MRIFLFSPSELALLKAAESGGGGGVEGGGGGWTMGGHAIPVSSHWQVSVKFVLCIYNHDNDILKHDKRLYLYNNDNNILIYNEGRIRSLYV